MYQISFGNHVENVFLFVLYVFLHIIALYASIRFMIFFFSFLLAHSKMLDSDDGADSLTHM